MPALRRRYNYGHIILSSELKHPTKSMTGLTVAVLLKTGETRNIDFGGFVSAAFGQRIKIVDIVAYTAGDGLVSDWVDLEIGTILLGQYINGKAYAVWPLVEVPKLYRDQ